MKNLFKKNKMGIAILSYSLIFIILVILLNIFSPNLFVKLESLLEIDKFIDFRKIIINFFNTGKFNFFTWDVFLGTDNFINYLYLMLGDILSYSCILFPKSSLDTLYIVLIFVRLFLIGISFIFYSKRCKNTNSSSIVGALLYVFSSYSLFLAINNPYILNLLILVPFIFIGIEKLIIDNKMIFFILITALSILTNSYFLPFILLLIIIYSSILIFNKYFIYGLKIIINAYLRVFISLIVSILLSSLILVPFIFYNINYILNTNNYFDISLLGLNGLFLVYFPLGFKKFKENKNYIILFVLMFILTVLSIQNNYSSIFYNGIGFVLSFISAVIISKTIDLYSNISRIDFKWIISFIFMILLFIYLFDIEISRMLMFALMTGIGYLVILLNKKELNYKFNLFGLLFYIFLIGSILISGVNYFNSIGIDKKEIEADGSLLLKNEIKDGSLYRVVIDQSNLINIDNYNYLNNKYYSFDKDLNILSMKDFNNRTKLLSLIGEKYYISSNGDLYVPKKHKLLFEKDGYSVFENTYYVGFAAFYDNYVPSNIYKEFNSIEKESSLSKSVVLDDKDINNKYLSQSFSIRDDISTDVIRVKSSVREEEGKLYISINSVNNNGELYLEINNFESNSGFITFEFRDRIYKKEVSSKEDLLINFTSFGSFEEDIVVDLSNLNNYSYDNINTYIVNFDSYVKDIEKLKSSNFNIISYKDGYLKGEVNSSGKGILQFSTAYSENFDVLVDGKKVETYLVNNYFLGIYLDEGIHEIELIYSFKYNSLKYILFSVGILLFCGILIVEKGKNGVRHEKRKKRN